MAAEAADAGMAVQAVVAAQAELAVEPAAEPAAEPAVERIVAATGIIAVPIGLATGPAIRLVIGMAAMPAEAAQPLL